MSRIVNLSGFGATPDPVELNKETYRTRYAIAALSVPGNGKVIRNYKAGEVVGKMIEAKTYENRLWFRTSYGGWVPYIYGNFYYANLKPVELTADQKAQIIFDIGKLAAPMTSPSIDILDTAGKVTENVVEGATDLTEFLGEIASYAKWIVIVGGIGYGIHLLTEYKKATK